MTHNKITISKRSVDKVPKKGILRSEKMSNYRPVCKFLSSRFAEIRSAITYRNCWKSTTAVLLTQNTSHKCHQSKVLLENKKPLPIVLV